MMSLTEMKKEYARLGKEIARLEKGKFVPPTVDEVKGIMLSIAKRKENTDLYPYTFNREKILAEVGTFMLYWEDNDWLRKGKRMKSIKGSCSQWLLGKARQLKDWDINTPIPATKRPLIVNNIKTNWLNWHGKRGLPLGNFDEFFSSNESRLEESKNREDEVKNILNGV